MVKRVFVEKKDGFNVEADAMISNFADTLGISGIEKIRFIVRYDVSGITEEQYAAAKPVIFSEPQIDNVYDEVLPVDDGDRVFATEFLPGQYDQRADFAEQALQIITQGEKPKVRAARVIVIKGNISDEDFAKIKNYSINPVEAREASLDKPENLEVAYDIPTTVETVEGFIDKTKEQLQDMIGNLGLAMDIDDITFCQKYFKETEKRNPTITEIRMIDTYWSDHCRHTTFLTKLEDVKFHNDYIEDVFKQYMDTRKYVYGDRDKSVCLMDIATMAVKKLKKDGVLDALDESEEINACSIKVTANVDGKDEQWLVMFKNETHNHPTEIEPFGGAATCLGGAIRDPLSGRVYVYQAMRVTGAGDPTKPLSETLPGKLPQRKLTNTAAAGYSSYGNQIGLATGSVTEIYDEGYVAKRMEIGAVVGAAPASNVVREQPSPTDVIILLGGRTGRDGCGGATGSSKAHTEESLTTCGAEVQKGNPPEERKLQRLFRNPEVTHLIKRCNDFGAGGVSVAIGELADGLEIDLNKVPKKYEGLSGTELAISESQERMAVVIRAKDEEKFIALASEENLEATKVAVVTDKNRLVMNWNGNTICDISRDFLNTNGAEKRATAEVEEAGDVNKFFKGEKASDIKEKWLETVGSLNVCSQKGLVERFDSSIGANTVFMPYGGINMMSPMQSMVAKLPVLNGETTTGTVMAYGYNPKLSKLSPFHGAIYAVVESVAKIVATGGEAKDAYLTFQEYFERLRNVPSRWGKPVAALLGGYLAQTKLGIAAIGGKDSMSGSFENIDVPPTLVSFAINKLDVTKAVSTDIKEVGSKLYLIKLNADQNMIPDFEDLKSKYAYVNKLIKEGKIKSSFAVTGGGICEAVSKMSFGNGIGAEITYDDLFAPLYGSIIVETNEDIDGIFLGTTIKDKIVANGVTLEIKDVVSKWTKTLEKVFPTKAGEIKGEIESYSYDKRNTSAPAVITGKPKVLIPVFPGTNCEYDTMRAFRRAGAETEIFVFRNLTAKDLNDSVMELSKRINEAQIVMLPGGFSAGDEPDGSAKFIATTFRNPRLTEDIHNLLYKRDGLMLGICNGFQALIKLGLVPFGKIVPTDDTCPTLTYNKINRHVSQIVYTKVASTLSPWFSNVNVGDIHSVAVSHGEGRFVADSKTVETLAKNGQIATQYVDLNGNPTYDITFNPNGSVCAIEGITSPDGRVLGKMAHSERLSANTYKNIYGEKEQGIFKSGVQYFK